MIEYVITFVIGVVVGMVFIEGFHKDFKKKKLNESGKYSIAVYCKNCKENYLVEIQKGISKQTAIKKEVCSNCGLKTMKEDKEW
jgi:predicted HicB family RNase H-like nuclease